MHTFARTVALISSVFVAIASGTPYLYGVYAPQFVKHVGLTASDSATMSLASNIGSGVGGLPAGLFIDHAGPQWSIFVGAVFIWLGYFSIHRIYDSSYSNLALICVAMMCIGFGSIIAYFATLKAAQSNFPKHRGVAGSMPASAYGLSATIFSFVAAKFFSDNTGKFLEFLSFFCGSITFVGSFFVHIYLDHAEDEHTLAHKPSVNSINSAVSVESFEPPKPNHSDRSLRGSLSFWGIGNRTPSVSSLASEIQPILQNLRESSSGQNQAFYAGTTTPSRPETPLLRPKAASPITVVKNLLLNKLFLYNYCLLGLLGGLGQMYIYTVGFVATAQFHYEPNMMSSTRTAAQFQALQVSLISICSFTGRLTSGFVSDYLYKKYHLPRMWCILTTSSVLFAGHLSLVLNKDNIHLMSLTSVLIGGSFGLIFGVYPAIIADSFGTKTFSTTWGLICTGPLFSLYLLNKYFGFLYDENTDPETGICYKGNGCYKGAYEVSSLLCVVAFFICLVLIRIQKRN